MSDESLSNMKFTRRFTAGNKGPTRFLSGQLVVNRAGRVHDGSILDRLLTVQHSGRTNFEVCDPSWPISTEIAEGQRYELLIVATQFQKLIFPTQPFEGVKLGVWRGKVIQASWSAQEDFRCARPQLYRRQGGKRRTWAILATNIGRMLVNPREIKEWIGFDVEAGDYLLWETSRFDLYGVR